MATTLGLDPCTLKFTAVTVDVSALTSRCRSKAFVISSQTTSRDLADMVIRKLALKGDAAPSVCVIGKCPDGSGDMIMGAQDKLLTIYSRRQLKGLAFQLVPQVKTELKHSSCDSLSPEGASPLLHPQRGHNGLSQQGTTRPGPLRPLAVRKGFTTSTPDLEVGRPAPPGDFLARYSPLSQINGDGRCRSLDINPGHPEEVLSRPDSLGNRSDPYLLLSQNGGADSQLSPPVVSTSSGSSGRPLDGFQILQQRRMGCQATTTPRHTSDGQLQKIAAVMKGVKLTSSDPEFAATGNTDTSSSSGSPLRGPVTIKRRRSLPRMTKVDEAKVEEKRRSVTDLFASKMRSYIRKAKQRAEEKYQANIAAYTAPPEVRNRGREDDVISVTSEEVAEIMACASPMKPYEEDEETDEDDDVSNDNDDVDDMSFATHDSGQNTPVLRTSAKKAVTNVTPTPSSAFQKYQTVKPQGHSIEAQGHSVPAQGHNVKPQGYSTHVDLIRTNGSHYDVINCGKDQGQGHGVQKVKGQGHSSKGMHGHEEIEVSDIKNRTRGSLSENKSQSVDHSSVPSLVKGSEVPGYYEMPSPVSSDSGKASPPSSRGLPLFVLLATHHLASAAVRLDASNGHVGIRLCDVTYAKCVRHVVGNHSSPVDLHGNGEKRLVAIGGMDCRAAVIETGRLFRGDVLVEVNGTHVLSRSAREVATMVAGSRRIQLVLARPKQSIQRAQSP